MDIFKILITFTAGVIAGIVNVSAGGGSLLTLPALIFLGLPTAVANGTNRIGILCQNIVAAGNFRRHGFRDFRLAIKLGIPAAIGAVIGSMIAVDITDKLFKAILSGVMILAIIVILSRRTTPKNPASKKLKHPNLQYLMFFFIGFYGGFIQAGVGYLLIFSMFTVGGLSLLRTNNIKLIVTGIYLIPSLVVFAANDKIAWLPALILASGSSLGGWLGTTFAVKKGEKWIRIILTIAVVAMAGRLLGFY